MVDETGLKVEVFFGGDIENIKFVGDSEAVAGLLLLTVSSHIDQSEDLSLHGSCHHVTLLEHALVDLLDLLLVVVLDTIDCVVESVFGVALVPLNDHGQLRIAFVSEFIT